MEYIVIFNFLRRDEAGHVTGKKTVLKNLEKLGRRNFFN